jgi:hypothetical protein
MVFRGGVGKMKGFLVDKWPTPTYYFPIMASGRQRLRVDGLLTS